MRRRATSSLFKEKIQGKKQGDTQHDEEREEMVEDWSLSRCFQSVVRLGLSALPPSLSGEGRKYKTCDQSYCGLGVWSGAEEDSLRVPSVNSLSSTTGTRGKRDKATCLAS